jgi:hypothetical protein
MWVKLDMSNLIPVNGSSELFYKITAVGSTAHHVNIEAVQLTNINGVYYKDDVIAQGVYYK